MDGTYRRSLIYCPACRSKQVVRPHVLTTMVINVIRSIVVTTTCELEKAVCSDLVCRPADLSCRKLHGIRLEMSYLSHVTFESSSGAA
jgi:hypothetical protein